MSTRGTLLILCALPAERAPIAHRLGLAREGDVWRGARRDTPIVAATVGIGPERAERRGEALVARERPAAVLIAGVAGALRPGLAVAHVLIPAEVVRASDGRRLRPPLDQSHGGAIRTSGAVVTVATVAASARAKAELHRRHRADAVDMESAALAGVCERRGVAWLCVRAISDEADTDVPTAALGLVDAEGRPRLGAALRHFLFHPRDLPRLLRFGRDTRAAVRELAVSVDAVVIALAG